LEYINVDISDKYFTIKTIYWQILRKQRTHSTTIAEKNEYLQLHGTFKGI